MSEKTCGNCRHKGEPITTYDWSREPPEKATDYFLCGLIKMGPSGGGYGSEREKHGSSYVRDGSDYHAALCVAEDFGCNRWEAAGG